MVVLWGGGGLLIIEVPLYTGKKLSPGMLQEAHASASWGSWGCGRFIRGEVL